jgi:hypothetical protein
VTEVPISDELDVCGWKLCEALGLLKRQHHADRMAGFTGGIQNLQELLLPYVKLPAKLTKSRARLITTYTWQNVL